MMFVGREWETKQIIKEIHQGVNIIVSGKFGMGRTALVKKISEILADERKFIFLDFSETPGQMAKRLMRELGLSSRNKKTGRKMGYKSMRYRIVTVRSSAQNKPIIVFDNIAKLTPQKIIFLRNLLEERHFQIIAIVENFLPAKDLLRLKAQLYPTKFFALNHLRPQDVLTLIHLYSDKYDLNWPDTYIRELVSLVGRYPLGIIEMVRKQARERNWT